MDILYDRWRIELFGGLTAHQGECAITRFRTQKTAALLGLLAFKPGLSRSRDVIVDMLWPDADPDSGRLSLRVALTSLRHQFEPPGTPRGAVLQSDYASIRLNPDAVSTDLADYEALVADARLASDSASRISKLEEAIRLYRGPLLSGLYEDWVIAEQTRLADGHRAAMSELIRLLRERGDVRRGMEVAHQLASMDPLNEAAQQDLIELYVMAGDRKRGVRQYEQFAARLEAEMGERPSESLRLALESAAEAPSPPRRAAFDQPLREAEDTTSWHGLSHLESARQRQEAHIRLPATFTRFFDRHDELASLEQMLAPGSQAGLVTVTGPGGTGKTRLAIEAARRWHAAGNGSVWFVPLADLVNAADLPAAVGAAIGLRSRTDDPLEALVERLSGGRALLVLDNFEQIVDAAARIVRKLLEQAPDARLLVTSRQRLNLDGERELPLKPLPAPSAPGTPERLSEFASVQLLVDRAKAIRPDFDITARNAASIATLCDRLEGIPLAIELAAGWLQALTPEQMIGRLDRRFELLVSRRRDCEPRHQTLEAALDWSYNQLDERLQTVLRRLSVFRAGFSIFAAAKVCGFTARESLSALADLQERSLIATEEACAESSAPHEMRGRLLETIREYAANRSEPDERIDCLHRHARYFADLACEIREGMRGPDQPRWLAVAAQDHENFRIALETSVNSADAEVASSPELRATGLRLCAYLWRAWYHRGHAREMRSLIDCALAATPSEPSAVRAHALLGAGVLAMFLRDFEAAEPLVSESLVMRRALGDRDGEAESLNALGSLASMRGDVRRAIHLGERALAIRRELGGPWAIANSLGNLANYAERVGERSRARDLYVHALQIQRESRDDSGRCNSLLNLAGLAYLECRYTEAAQLYEEVIGVARGRSLVADIANALKGCAETRREQGDFASAEGMLTEALTLFRELGDRFGSAVCLRNLSAVLLCERRLAEARTCANESVDLFTSTGSGSELALTLHTLAMIADSSGDHDGALTYVQRSLELADAAEDGRPVARSLELLCALSVGTADPVALCEILAAVDAWRSKTSIFRPPSLAGPYRRATIFLAETVQGEARAAAECRGKGQGLTEAAAAAAKLI